MTKRPYRSEEEILQEVRQFESGELPLDDFNHRAHLAVALTYQLQFTDQEALGRMRQAILGFLRSHDHDTGVYHETLTAFWMRRVRSFINRAGADRPLLELANSLIEESGDSRLALGYYSREVIDSEEARCRWVEPDLKPLDF